ncbi:uncharacterized protein LOC129591107 [Paramacrobiotus metropolitanus]|uniref:uncharacterized protein LOC129591107 n=1 Tax=Paramacrobiotus metropolitanus TaxID=2943436 RepID=UPI002445E5DB|nr:uncharacterized protein LOC129591107 [Paramacrobiotus metropolitanus]
MNFCIQAFIALIFAIAVSGQRGWSNQGMSAQGNWNRQGTNTRQFTGSQDNWSLGSGGQGNNGGQANGNGAPGNGGQNNWTQGNPGQGNGGQGNFGQGNTAEATGGPVRCHCTKIYMPVCGVNGVTYGNECMAKCSDAEVARRGRCDGTGPILIPRRN